MCVRGSSRSDAFARLRAVRMAWLLHHACDGAVAKSRRDLRRLVLVVDESRAMGEQTIPSMRSPPSPSTADPSFTLVHDGGMFVRSSFVAA